MTEFRKEALEDFVIATDGAPPPVFIGREDILNRVEDLASSIWKGPGAPKHNTGKASTIVQGTSGAGKSSLLDEIKARSTNIDVHPSNQSRVIFLSSAGLMHNISYANASSCDVQANVCGIEDSHVKISNRGGADLTVTTARIETS